MVNVNVEEGIILNAFLNGPTNLKLAALKRLDTKAKAGKADFNLNVLKIQAGGKVID